MNKVQVLIVIFDSIILVLGVWSLVLSIQNMKLEEMKNKSKRRK